MGILDKVMFWKKKDEFKDLGLGDKDNLAFGNEFGAAPGTGLGPTPGTGQGFGQQSQGFTPPEPTPRPSMPSYPQPQFQQQQSYGSQDTNAKMEVISSKLDAVRASLDSLNQRLANLEAIARGEEPRRRRGYY